MRPLCYPSTTVGGGPKKLRKEPGHQGPDDKGKKPAPKQDAQGAGPHAWPTQLPQAPRAPPDRPPAAAERRAAAEAAAAATAALAARPPAPAKSQGPRCAGLGGVARSQPTAVGYQYLTGGV